MSNAPPGHVVNVNAMNSLESWCASHGLPPPEYVSVCVEQGKDKYDYGKWTSRVFIAGLNAYGFYDEDHFTSKRSALLEKDGIYFPSNDPSPRGHAGRIANSPLASRNNAAIEAVTHIRFFEAFHASPPEARPFAEHIVYLPNGEILTPATARAYALRRLEPIMS